MSTTKHSAICLALAALAFPQQVTKQGKLLAQIGDAQIFEDDILPSINGELLKLRDREYELRLQAVKNLIDQRLVAEEAAKRGISSQALLSQEVDSKVAPTTETEVKAYYAQHKDPLDRPFETIRPQLETTVTGLKRARARSQFLEELRKAAGVSIFVDRPRSNVAPDPLRVRGNPDAPVTLIEFADFQCPYCQDAEPVVQKILSKYKDTIKFGFLDFPLKPIHPLAEKAAEASRCAGDQSKYWEYHDRLFMKGARLDPEGMRDLAKAIGLDASRFNACLETGQFAWSVENDLKAGAWAGVPATPTFFVNGIALVGLQSQAELEALIESELHARSGWHVTEP